MSIRDILQQSTLELTKNTNIKQRLVAAFSNHLKNANPAELPAALREELSQVQVELEATEPLPGESRVQATVRKMANDTAERYAARIVLLFSEVASGQSRQIEWRAVSDGTTARTVERAESAQNVIPLFAAAEA